MRNPFQLTDLHELPWWRDVPRYDDKNQIFETLTQDLENAFQTAVHSGAFRRFAQEYTKVATAMFEQMPTEPLLATILERSYRRLITFYCYLRQRRRSERTHLQGDTSIVKWQIEPDLLVEALKQADEMQQAGVSSQEFSLQSSPKLLRWIRANYWPLVSKFGGTAAVPITYAHIRCIDADKKKDGYRDRFRHHCFGNHHFDHDVYSLPLLIYLSDVSINDGPFEYLSASDRYSHNFVLRAFHQSINHDCQLTSLEDTCFASFAKLPSVFRGGDAFGNFYPQSEFEKAGPVVVEGGAGTTILFDGFNTVHAGGLPRAGIRKSLFVNFRFPVAKILPEIRSLLSPPRPTFASRLGA